MESIDQIQKKHLMQCWSAQKNYQPEEIIRTEGCYLYTKNGKKIFDLRSAHESINLGFNHPAVLEAIRNQLDEVIYVTDDFATEPTALLAQRLAQLSPGDSNKKIWFGQSGAGAVEAALKAARFAQYVKKKGDNDSGHKSNDYYSYPYKIISRYRSWHGSTAGALSVSGDPRRWFAEPLVVPGTVFGPDVYPYRSPFGDDPDGLKSAEYINYQIEMEGGSNFVAAVLIEPVVGSNGIIPAPLAYIKRIREICDHHDIFLILDETMTGFGRTGKFLAIEHYDVEPDIIIMGKALGSYIPLSACILSEKVWKHFDNSIFGHGQSFSGHALASKAALASLEVLLHPDFLPKVQDLGNYLGNRLNELATKYEFIGDVRGMGFMWTLELVKNKERKEPVRSTSQKYSTNPIGQIATYLRDVKNIYIPSDKFGIWITPPLITTKDEIDYIVDAIDEALEKTEESNLW